ncbi:hypothetical protein N7481_003281 [Penicillium waksmanii]|uniref:uncharacterized protein n=1 Tax=Penicillium waksmanii TaxID=69791 RepID=UPI0025481DA3|nr:uncharacterized protein N7481_003281 [Penicillium waksmanii]KAJ5988071.1 hypothetical protein N7481_003281 [Penicillium waksmanii]
MDRQLHFCMYKACGKTLLAEQDPEQVNAHLPRARLAMQTYRPRSHVRDSRSCGPWKGGGNGRGEMEATTQGGEGWGEKGKDGRVRAARHS